METNWKPCPHCGNSPVPDEDGDIYCPTCELTVYAKEVAWWNTRPIEDALQTELMSKTHVIGVRQSMVNRLTEELLRTQDNLTDAINKNIEMRREIDRLREELDRRTRPQPPSFIVRTKGPNGDYL